MLPGALFLGCALAIGVFVVINLWLSGLTVPLPVWGILGFYDVLVGYLVLSFLGRMLRPASIEIEREGFVFNQDGKAQSWTWSEVSDFSAGPQVNGVYFEARSADPRRRVALPGFWPGGPRQMVAWLNAAKDEVGDAASSEGNWLAAKPPAGRPLLAFAVTFASCLIAILGWSQIVTTIHHHPWIH